MEYIGSGWIIHNNDLLQFSPQFVQVFHVISPMEDTTFPKQSGPKHTPLIQQIRDWIRIFRQWRSEQHTLVQFTHTFQELVYVGPLQYVHLVNGAVDLHRYDEIRIAYWLKQNTTINKCVTYIVQLFKVVFFLS